MKRLPYILFSLLLLASCMREELPQTEGREVLDSDKVLITFNMGIPSKAYDTWSEAAVETKSLGELTDEARLALKLRLYVFDESGFLVEVQDAKSYANDNSFETGSRNETKFSVQLTRSQNPRTIHFVAVDTATVNKTFDEVVHAAYQYGSEATFMSGLSVGNNVDAYWGKVVMPKIDGPTAEDPDVEPTTFTRIPMIRNYSKITVREPSLDDFTFKGFALVNVPAYGSAAPYNSTTGSFVTYNYDGTENVKSYKEISAEGYSGYLPLGIEDSIMWTSASTSLTDASFTTNAKYLYECPNSLDDVKGRTYIIIKGDYKNTLTGTTYTNRYYKVDIVYKDTETYGEPGVSTYYNILRNFNYIININEVSFEGYSTIAEAAEKPASNNISASALAEGVNNVSDGNGSRRLFVNKTYALYTVGGDKSGELSIKAITSEGANATLENLNIAVLDDEGIFEVQPTISSTLGTDGYRSINFKLNTPTSVPKSATIRVYVKEENFEVLFRDITVVLRDPYDLRIDCTDVVPTGLNQNLNAQLVVQDGINKALFPMVFLMEPEKQSLSPWASQNQLPVHVGPTIIDDSGATSFQFEREVTYEEYMAAPTKTIGTVKYRLIDAKYKTTLSESATTVYAQNEYFSSDNANDSFKNGTPVFIDGDDAFAVIYPSDYFGAGNSKNRVSFKTVRNTGSVNVYLTEEGHTLEMLNYNLAAGTNNGDGTWTHTVEFLTQTFKGTHYSVSVTYNNEFTQTIEGTAEQKRRYLYLPLGSFETNINTTNGYLTEEYFRACINVAGTAWVASGSQPEYMGKIYVSQSGVNYAYGRAAEYDTDYKGWKFADDSGYHMGIDAYHPNMELTEDMVFHFYDPQSKKNVTWTADVRVGDVTAAHAKDFQANATDNASAPADGLFRMALTFAEP